MRLSAIIPAYNEERVLGENIARFDHYLKKQDFDYEIVIVNDGSTDRTALVAAALREKIKTIRLLDNRTNRGKGAAVRQGMLAARGDYRLFLDADNSTPIDCLVAVWPKFAAGADIVIGSRHPRDAAGACQNIPQARWKRLLGSGGNWLIRQLAIRDIWDTQCGFKIFRREASEAIFRRATIDRWLFDLEVLVLAQKLGFGIAKIPITWNCDHDSKVGINGYFTSLKEISKIKWKMARGEYDKN